MKYLILFLFASCAAHLRVSTHPDAIDKESAAMVALLDSIDRYPAQYNVTLYRPDTSIHRLHDVRHRFEGFKRQGTDSLGRQRVLLYNRMYACKYSYVVNDQWKGETYNVDSASVKSITILTDRAGVWVSHYGCEYLIIITTK